MKTVLVVVTVLLIAGTARAQQAVENYKLAEARHLPPIVNCPSFDIESWCGGGVGIPDNIVGLKQRGEIDDATYARLYALWLTYHQHAVRLVSEMTSPAAKMALSSHNQAAYDALAAFVQAYNEVARPLLQHDPRFQPYHDTSLPTWYGNKYVACSQFGDDLKTCLIPWPGPLPK